MKNDMIFDMETFGVNTLTCPVIECSWLIFNRGRFCSTNPYSYDELIDSAKKSKLNVAEQVKNGSKMEKGALNFWETLPKETRALIKPLPSDVSEKEFLTTMFADLKRNDVYYWWSRSNMFDPAILARMAYNNDMEAEYKSALHYGNVRDTRTFIDARTNFDKDMNSFIPLSDEKYWNTVFKHHDSTHDIAADVLRLQTLCRLEADMAITDR